jgi:hypothetical protein
MYDFVEFDGWKSNSESDLHVLNVDMPVMNESRKNSMFLPDNMRAIIDDRRLYTEMNIEITMAVVGSGLPALLSKLRKITCRIYNAKCIKLSDMPDYFYMGYVSKIEKLEENDNWIKFKAIFCCNPPCALKTLKSGFIPDGESPAAVQIKESNASFSASLTGASEIKLFDEFTAYMPEVHLKLSGTWDTLNISGLKLPKKCDSALIYYIDVLRGKCFKYGTQAYPVVGLEGTYKNIGIEPMLRITGQNISAQIQGLVIERS